MIQLHETEWIYDTELRTRLEYVVYIWVLRVFKTSPTDRRPRDQLVHAFFFKQPVDPNRSTHYRKIQRKVSIGYIQKLMAGKRYNLLSEDCHWTYKRSDSEKFYKVIRLVAKQ